MSTPSDARRFGPVDLVIILGIVTVAVSFIPVMHGTGPGIVRVRCDGRTVARYPLGRPAEFRVNGIEGPLDIRIDSSGVAVVGAACRNRICMRTGHIARPGQRIICAPNHVVIEIQSADAGGGPDAVAR